MIFEIYSMGDGLYMKRILDGVAMMSNSGFLMALGGFGLMLGLLLAGMKAIETGGQKVELPSLFVSFILILAMFSIKVPTAIYALDGAPGAGAMRVYTVDNVPIGVAFPSMAVTTLGKVITEKFQQAFGVPGMEELGSGEFGNTLKLVDMTRRWDIEGLRGRPNSKVSNFRRNLTSYVSNCTIPGIMRGAISRDALLGTATPFSMHNDGNGIGFNDQWTTTMYVAGSESLVNCDEGFVALQRDSNDAGMVTEFLKGAMAMTDARSDGDANNKANDAFAALGTTTDTLRDHMMASAIREIMDEAIVGSNSLSPENIQSQIMLIQAQRQRQDEWGAGELMFRKAMRPFMAFLECFAFIATPFMVMVIGLGSMGLRIVGKYFMVNLWIMTWAPMFAAVDLFQVTMVQHAVTAMEILHASSNGVALSSIAGAAALNQEITTWISVGGWMATLVPPLGYLLLSGGAVAMTSFAGRLSGGDHVNEKMTSPDLMTVKEAMSVNSSMSHSRGTGTEVTGVDPVNGSFQIQSNMSTRIESASGVMQKAEVSAMAAIDAAIAKEVGNTTSVNSGEQQQSSKRDAVADGTTVTRSNDTTTTSGDNARDEKSVSESTAVNVGGSASGEVGKSVGGSNKEGGGRGPSGKGGAGVKAGGEVKEQVQQSNGYGSTATIVEKDSAIKAEVHAANSSAEKVAILSRAAQNGSTSALKALDSYRRSKAASDLDAATESYNDATTEAATLQTLSGVSYQQWSNHVHNGSGTDEAVANAINLGGSRAYQMNLSGVHDQMKNGLFRGTEDQARAMAAGMTLAGAGKGALYLTPGMAEERMAALADLTNKYSIGAGTTPTGDAHRNNNLPGSRLQYGDAAAEVGTLDRHNLPSRAAVIGRAGANIAAGSGVDVDGVERAGNFAESMRYAGPNRDRVMGGYHSTNENQVLDTGKENLGGILQRGDNLGKNVRAAASLDDRWGNLNLVTTPTHGLAKAGYFSSTDVKIPDSVGYDPLGVMGDKPAATYEEYQNEYKTTPIARDESRATIGDSGDTRYQELVRDTRNNIGLTGKVVDDNFISALAAARLVAEETSQNDAMPAAVYPESVRRDKHTGNIVHTGGNTVYLTEADANQVEKAFSALTPEQRQILTDPGTALNTGRRPGGDDLRSAVDGDAYTSPQIAHASLGMKQPVHEVTDDDLRLQAMMPRSGIPDERKLANDLNSTLDGLFSPPDDK